MVPYAPAQSSRAFRARAALRCAAPAPARPCRVRLPARQRRAQRDPAPPPAALERYRASSASVPRFRVAAQRSARLCAIAADADTLRSSPARRQAEVVPWFAPHRPASLGACAFAAVKGWPAFSCSWLRLRSHSADQRSRSNPGSAQVRLARARPRLARGQHSRARPPCSLALAPCSLGLAPSPPLQALRLRAAATPWRRAPAPAAGHAVHFRRRRANQQTACRLAAFRRWPRAPFQACRLATGRRTWRGCRRMRLRTPPQAPSARQRKRWATQR